MGPIIVPDGGYAQKKIEHSHQLILTAKPNLIPAFAPLLQSGFRMQTLVDVSTREILCADFGLSAAYVNDRIKTIFINGRPVDDIDTAVVGDGSTLALSGAMPGLAGATLRRGGTLAPFRSAITHVGEALQGGGRQGMIMVKLFNLLVGELGPLFLRRGILLKGRALEGAIASRRDDFQSGCTAAEPDNREMTFDEMMAFINGMENGLVLLRVPDAGVSTNTGDLEKSP